MNKLTPHELTWSAHKVQARKEPPVDCFDYLVVVCVCTVAKGNLKKKKSFFGKINF